VIHQTAIIHPDTCLGENVKVGPYAVIGEKVTIGNNCTVGPHAIIEGESVIGESCMIHPHAVIGSAPQDMKYRGEATSLHIGKGCVFREGVTVNRGTEQGGGKTIIGDNCLFMANSHVAHDCKLGQAVVLANSVALAGHAIIGDFVWFGGLVGIHQFVRIGNHAFIGAGSMVRKDIPPYMIAQGDRAKLVRVNETGLRRHKFSEDKIQSIVSFYSRIKAEGMDVYGMIAKGDRFDNDCCKGIIEFIKGSHEGISKFL